MRRQGSGACDMGERRKVAAIDKPLGLPAIGPAPVAVRGEHAGEGALQVALADGSERVVGRSAERRAQQRGGRGVLASQRGVVARVGAARALHEQNSVRQPARCELKMCAGDARRDWAVDGKACDVREDERERRRRPGVRVRVPLDSGGRRAARDAAHAAGVRKARRRDDGALDVQRQTLIHI